MSYFRRRPTIAAAALLLAVLPSAAPARSFALTPEQIVVGDVGEYITKYKDTLLDVARDNDLGYTELVIANSGIDPWIPGKDKKIVLPQLYLLPEGPRRGIVINLAQQRAYYFPPGGKTVETYPIGLGVQGWVTPVGTTRVVAKEVHPGWTPPASIRAEKPELPSYVPPGPDNPLGDFAMRLGWNSYLLHGTNKPYGVGRNVSHGCIRFYPEDIARLFGEVGIGTPVRVIEQETVAGWIGNRLYVAVFPNKKQTDQIDIEQPMTQTVPDDLVERIRDAAGDRVDRVDWAVVTRLGMERSGIPTAVTPPVVAAAERSQIESRGGDFPINAPVAMEVGASLPAR